NGHEQSLNTLENFLSRIGPQNTSFLRMLHVPFPHFEFNNYMVQIPHGIKFQAGGSISLHPDSIRFLDLMHSRCSIRDLTFSLWDMHAEFLDTYQYLQVYCTVSDMTAAFKLVYDRVKAMESVRSVALDVVPETLYVEEFLGWE